jgi:hypothetical protein
MSKLSKVSRPKHSNDIRPPGSRHPGRQTKRTSSTRASPRGLSGPKRTRKKKEPSSSASPPAPAVVTPPPVAPATVPEVGPEEPHPEGAVEEKPNPLPVENMGPAPMPPSEPLVVPPAVYSEGIPTEPAQAGPAWEMSKEDLKRERLIWGALIAVSWAITAIAILRILGII